MKITHRRALKAEEERKDKNQKAEERETAFRQAEKSRMAANQEKTSRLKALRLAHEAAKPKEV